MGVLTTGKSDIERTGGGRMLAWHTGLLMDAGAGEPLNSGMVSPAGASALGSVTVGSVSLTEHMGHVPGLAVPEWNQGRSLTKSAWLIWQRTSLNVVSTCRAILAHWSFWFWANSHSSWALALITAHNCLRAMLKLIPLSLWAHVPVEVKGGSRDWQQHKGEQAMALTWALPQGLFEEWDNL